MTVKENKKGAASALFLAIALFCAGFAGYFYYALGGTGIFTMAVAVICAVLCVKKIFQVSFLRIEDDGFLVQKGGKNAKFYFKDIDEIAIKSFGDKKKVETLSVKFKKNRLDRDACFGLVQPLGDDLIIIFDKYELSKFTISKELRDRLNNFRA